MCIMVHFDIQIKVSEREKRGQLENQEVQSIGKD